MTSSVGTQHWHKSPGLGSHAPSWFAPPARENTMTDQKITERETVTAAAWRRGS